MKKHAQFHGSDLEEIGKKFTIYQKKRLSVLVLMSIRLDCPHK